MEARNQLRNRAAMLSLVFNIVSTVVKFGAAIVTGSLGLLSEALHSTSDIVSSAIALLSVRVAMSPADEDHPYGHGKAENLAAFAESILLFGVVAFVFFDATERLIAGEELNAVPLGIGVMLASTVGAFAVYGYVSHAARQTESLALASNAQHLFADAVTSLGVLLSLVVVQFTGWEWLDPVVAILMSVWIGVNAGRLGVRACHQLIDLRLPDADLVRIRTILDSEPGLCSYHRLRTRRLGAEREIDVHIVLPRHLSLVEAHALADGLEQRIESELAPAQVTIHVDPEDPENPGDPR